MRQWLFFPKRISLLLMVQVSAEINTANIPTLDGAMECLAAGVMSSMHSQNAKASAAVTNAEQAIQHDIWPLMVDPQTGTIATSHGTVHTLSLWSQDTRQRLTKSHGLKACMLKAVLHTRSMATGLCRMGPKHCCQAA